MSRRNDPPLPSGFAPLRPEDPVAVGPFSLVGRLGAGGMGAVYGALAPDGRRVAVKVVHPRVAADPVYREQFAQEAELLGRVDADCAPAILGADPAAEQPWLATSFVPGRTLTAHVRDRGVLDGERLLAFAAGTAEALSAIHAAGITHRDVKPANVILSPEGPRVLDFGIARDSGDASAERGVFGTPGWVAPERLSGSAGTAKADMFAWAGLVVYAATGRGPFGSGDTNTLLERARSGQADVSGLPDELRPLIAAALSPEPDERPHAVEALGAVLVLGGPGAQGQAARDRLRALVGRSWQGFEAVRGAGRWVVAGAALATATGSAASAGGAAGTAGTSGAAAAGGVTGGAAGGVLGSKVLLGVGAGALAVAVGAGGWMGGRVYAGEPLLPFGGGEEAAEADPSPENEDEDPEETVDYRGMTLSLPEGWIAETLSDESFQSDVPGSEGEPVVEDWLVLYPEDQDPVCTEDSEDPLDGDGEAWAWNDTTTGCEHLKVLGPGAMQYGGAGFAPLQSLENSGPNSAYSPTSNPAPCPRGQGVHPETSPDFRGDGEWDLDEVQLGTENATRTEGSATCMDPATGDLGYYVQRMWLLDGPEILVVDGYEMEEADDILASAEW
ncbi:hypothetical protein GCM10028793_31140 [Nocardiopsis oceani]